MTEESLKGYSDKRMRMHLYTTLCMTYCDSLEASVVRSDVQYQALGNLVAVAMDEDWVEPWSWRS